MLSLAATLASSYNISHFPPAFSLALISIIDGVERIIITCVQALGGAAALNNRVIPSMASSEIPTRLIYCVDGTYCTPDGTHHPSYGNISNVYRIWACIKKGRCFDKESKKEFNQEKHYEAGLGSADDIKLLDKATAGMIGKGYQDSIRRVYRECCRLKQSDEVWLFGFSRGAFVVRAVAGLLHHIGVLQSDEQDFDKMYLQALKKYVSADNRPEPGPGQVSLKTSRSLPSHFRSPHPFAY